MSPRSSKASALPFAFAVLLGVIAAVPMPKGTNTMLQSDTASHIKHAISLGAKGGHVNVTSPSDAHPAPAMAVSFMEGYNLPYGKIMATSTLIVIPVIVFALIASKHLVRGLTMGAVK